MNVRKQILIMGLIALLKSLGFAADGEAATRIFYRGKKDYIAAIQAAKITEKAAREILRDAVKGRSGAYFDSEPYLFVNGEYLFGVPEKGRLPLTGFYVNATTGGVVFRKSKFSVPSGEKRLPTNAYESEERLK
jgi:hypothetical protein